MSMQRMRTVRCRPCGTTILSRFRRRFASPRRYQRRCGSRAKCGSQTNAVRPSPFLPTPSFHSPVCLSTCRLSLSYLLCSSHGLSCSPVPIVNTHRTVPAWVSYLNMAILIGTLSVALFNASKDPIARNFAYVYSGISVGILVRPLLPYSLLFSEKKNNLLFLFFFLLCADHNSSHLSRRSMVGPCTSIVSP